MALSERIRWFVVADQGLYSGLVFSFSSVGEPTIAYWDRIDDLERCGFAPISAARARAMCDALPAFLERLDQAHTEGDR